MLNKTKSKAYNNTSLASASNGLKTSLAHLTNSGDLFTTAIPGLSLFRQKKPTDLITTIYELSICIVAQGAKRVILGGNTFVYDPRHYLITSVNLPTTIQVIKASPKKPYLGLCLKFNISEVSQLMIESNIPAAPATGQTNRGMAIGKTTLPLLTAFKRLVDLLQEPQDIPILAPLIRKEIIYRLLVGEQGTRLREIASAGSQSQNIAKVIDWIKANYTRPITIDNLTEQAHMSHSTFYFHFRSLTAMSPLQYIKLLRLYESRRLMLTENFDAASASFKVGYESPSQFSREYKRQFGNSPHRDIKKLRDS